MDKKIHLLSLSLLTPSYTHKEMYLYPHMGTDIFSFPPSISLSPLSLGKSIKMAAITSHLGFQICLPELLTRSWLLVGYLRWLSLRGVLPEPRWKLQLFWVFLERRNDKRIKLWAASESSKRAGWKCFHTIIYPFFYPHLENMKSFSQLFKQPKS